MQEAKKQITAAEVEYYAKLSKFNLTEEEKEDYAAKLGALLAYMGQLREIDVKGVPPTTHVLPLTNVFRADEAGQTLPLETALANAPQSEEGFVTPRII